LPVTTAKIRPVPRSAQRGDAQARRWFCGGG
jgi:hypothetical protein